MYLVEKAQKAAASLMNESIEIGGALLVIAIIIGTIAIPVFIAVNTTGWGATNIIIWGTILTVSFAALIMLVIGRFRREG
jgi:protein-S-isoprenylcysteine O-methyltransferase Ste14